VHTSPTTQGRESIQSSLTLNEGGLLRPNTSLERPHRSTQPFGRRMSAAADQVLAGIDDILAPQLASVGFARTKLHFRRVRGEVVDVISVTRSNHGDSLMVFLGMHLTFLPLEIVGDANRPFDLPSIQAANCAFRTSLLSRFWRHQKWKYSTLFRSPVRTVEALSSQYFRSGDPLFQHFRSAADFAALVTPQALRHHPEVKPFDCLGGPAGFLRFARIHAYLGNRTEARECATIGLELSGDVPWLKKPLREIALASQHFAGADA
jgi:Domain of unknown function (DUF4304)